MKKNIIVGLWATLIFLSGLQTVHALEEPNIADYTSYPVFMANSVQPNILVVLDNSGSMNGRAYTDDYGATSVSECGRETAQIVARNDDAMENLDNDDIYRRDSYVILGEGDVRLRRWRPATHIDTMVGLRFPEVELPPDVEITNAYIEFVASSRYTGNASFTIRGEDVGNAATFGSDDRNISRRNDTSASVKWSTDEGNLEKWYRDESHATPDLTSVVKEIAARDDWENGNAMAFTITGSGERRARTADGGQGARLVIEYDAVCDEEDDSTKYYGYFDPTSRYSYSSGFVRDSSGKWDGNWLNWLCMRKIDVARKVLVGGLVGDRDGSGVQDLYGEDPSGWDFQETTAQLALHA